MSSASEAEAIPAVTGEAAYLVQLGDDALVLGQRLAEWCGHGPTLEIDLALTNISLDQIGYAKVLLDSAAKLTGHAGGDALAFGRDALDFRNCLLVEQPIGDFARTIARQLLFSQWQVLLFDRLRGSLCPPLADLAPKAHKEMLAHLRFASEWAARLGDGTEESRARFEAGLAWCARFVDELFELDPAVPELIEQGIAVDPRDFHAEYHDRIETGLAAAGIAGLPCPPQVTGGRAGRHSEHLGHLLSELQFLPRAYPGAEW